MVKRLFAKILLLVITAFFGYTLVNKLMNIDGFIINVAKTSVFQGRMVDMVVLYALISEALCIVLLVVKERWGALVSLTVMLSYTLYVVYLKSVGKYEVCGCGGILNGLSFHWHLLINIFLILSLLYLTTYARED
jgi:hypothetical protein